MAYGTRMMVRPRHMALAAVFMAIGLLIFGAVDADAASLTGAHPEALPSPILMLPVLLTFAVRARD